VEALAARRFDLALALQPTEDGPAERSPRSANAPTGENIARVMDTEINAADANSDRE
jgi:hypothetical protein